MKTSKAAPISSLTGKTRLLASFETATEIGAALGASSTSSATTLYSGLTRASRSPSSSAAVCTHSESTFDRRVATAMI
jgi:hypothetical protein